MSVPKLRFPEFKNAEVWEVIPLEMVSDRIIEKVGTEILPTVSISAGFGFVTQSEKFGRDISGEQYKNYIVLCKGEFAYNKGNSKRYPQGCIYKLVEFERVASPNAFICFRLKPDYIADFYKQYFEANVHGKQLKQFITSGARSDGLLNIKPEDFFSILFATPGKEEQQKIADCLSSLDDLIATNNQKLAALKTYKKGLMQQLFPAEGETVPRRRFPEFRDTGEWEGIEIGCLGNVSMCKRILKEQTTTDGAIPFYKIGTFGKKPDSFISNETYYDYKRRFAYPKIGDILISAAGTIGRLVVFDGKPAYFQDSNIVWIDNDEKRVCNNFLYHCYTMAKWSTDDNTIPRLYNENLRKMRISAPLKDEQQKVADCLSSLDYLITIQAQKIQTLKQHKKGLMQQLFSGREEE